MKCRRSPYVSVELIYGNGAVVVNSAGQPISLNRTWVQAVRYPHRTTGLPDPDSSLTFEYFSDGSVASRTAALGTRFGYAYDESGRLIHIYVTYPTQELCPPPDRISHVAFTYDDEGKLLTATAYTPVDGVDELLTQNEYDYSGNEGDSGNEGNEGGNEGDILVCSGRSPRNRSRNMSRSGSPIPPTSRAQLHS